MGSEIEYNPFPKRKKHLLILYRALIKTKHLIVQTQLLVMSWVLSDKPGQAGLTRIASPRLSHRVRTLCLGFHLTIGRFDILMSCILYTRNTREWVYTHTHVCIHTYIHTHLCIYICVHVFFHVGIIWFLLVTRLLVSSHDLHPP